MKKIMSLMLGMSLILGAATVAFGQSNDTSKSSKKAKKAKKGSAKGSGSSSH
jgi:ABC-type phosphate transport system substrate-binding protein